MKEKKGYEIFEVGGCVRDEILGLKSKDIDFTFVLPDTSISVEQGFYEMTQYLTLEGYTIFLSTPDCFTIRAKFPKNHKFDGLVADFVMARKEVGYYEGTRLPKLEVGTLFDDLQRRDFTMNAIAKDIDGNLIDPFNGQEAIKNRIIDTPLDPSITFNDDPLRMLRAIRFMIVKDMGIKIRVWEALENIENWEKLFTVVSIERIREELFKCFEKNTVGTIRTLTNIEDFFPEPNLLERLFGNRLFLKPTIKE